VAYNDHAGKSSLAIIYLFKKSEELVAHMLARPQIHETPVGMLDPDAILFVVQSETNLIIVSICHGAAPIEARSGWNR
jgi:hypothetical protein